MTRRNKIIIAVVVAIAVLLIILGLLWFLNRSSAPKEVVNTNEDIQRPAGLPITPPGSINTPEELLAQPDLEAGLKAIALTFAERFGSYSNQGNFSNIDALRDLMTVRMKVWSDNYIANNKSSDNEVYYGITTKALSVQITSFEKDLGRAEIIVATQRQEAKGTTINPRIFYQDLKLNLVDSPDGWKVDRVEWQ